jgi:hypothetical protein
MVWIRAMQFSKTRRLRSRGRKKGVARCRGHPGSSRARNQALKTEQQLLDQGEEQPFALWTSRSILGRRFRAAS